MLHSESRHGCLTADEIASFAGGRLDESALTRIDAHLDVCPRCFDVVVASAAPATRPIGTGDRIGRYIIEELLGSGALGVVYAAVDETLHRRVALKLLRSDHYDPDGIHRRRMLREARALARLDHPNAVTVYDAGEVDGVGFVAMRLIDGTTLRERCRDRGWSDVLECYLAAAKGLIAAHEAGLVHRDFKPDNALVDSDARVYVCDFGLAGWSADPAAPARRTTAVDDLTATGRTPGTPLYMAPELWRGERASPASDQFAFCVALWEGIVGRPPFEAQTQAQLRTLLRTLPDDGPLREAGVPASIARAILRGLAVQPQRRHRSMSELARALRSRRRAHRAARVAGWAAAPLAIAGWMSVAAGHSQSGDGCEVGSVATVESVARPELDPEVTDRLAAALGQYKTRFAAADGAVCRAEVAQASAPSRCLDGRLAAYDRLVVALEELPAPAVRTQGLAATHSLPAPESCIDVRSGAASWPADVELRARLGHTVLVSERVLPLLEFGEIDPARDELDAALVELEAEPPSSYLVRARLSRLSVDEMRGVRIESAAYDELIDLATKHDDLVLAARLWTRRLGSAANRGAVAELPALLDTAKWAFDVAGKPEDHAAVFHEARGIALYQLQRYDEADIEVRAALEAVINADGTSHPKVAELRSALAMFAYRGGRTEDALAATSAAWADLEPAVDPGFPALARLALNLATYHSDLGHAADAVTWARRGLAVMERSAMDDPLLRSGLVETVVLNDDVPRALEEGRAFAIWAKNLDPYIRGRAERTAARAARRAEDFAGASKYLDAAETAFTEAGAKGDLVATRWERANVQWRLGDLDDAAALFAEVIANEKQIPHLDPALKVKLRAEAAEVAQARGRPQEAAQLLAAAQRERSKIQ